ncbi:MAG: SDR family NAD(P)-dependent oxidoreductase, partial [Proteobacteria bacterium]|nr:SDR family NAD(P)-dependent oxidoreductase [Pseudomonadota bacterium]
MQQDTLRGKVAIVTGAASPIGLGRSMTVALVRAGARVAMLDVNESWLEETANDLREIGG